MQLPYFGLVHVARLYRRVKPVKLATTLSQLLPWLGEGEAISAELKPMHYPLHGLNRGTPVKRTSEVFRVTNVKP